MYCTGCGANLPSGAMFCPNCGRRVSEDAGQSSGGSTSSATGFNSAPMSTPYPGFQGRSQVTFQFPHEAACIGGTFRYFGLKVDGREQPTDYKLGERIVLDILPGTHVFEVRQVNQAIIGGIAKLEFTREVRGGEVFSIEVVNRQLQLGAESGGEAPSVSSSTADDSSRRWY